MNLSTFFFKYFVYCPVILIRGEWIFPHLKKLLKSQYASPAEIEVLQQEKLTKLFQYAQAETEHYRTILPDNVSSLADLQRVPFLEKDTLRDSASRLRPARPRGMVRSKTTGGSTGAAVTIYKNNQAMAEELAATWRGYAWAGVAIGDLQARFWGVPLNKKSRLRAQLIDWVTNRIRLSAFSFSDADIARYIEVLNKKKPRYFYGYVSMIKQFAEYVIAHQISLQFRLQAVITTSEVLSDADRALLQRAFGCKVYNEYGCGEIGTIAHECEHGKMHLTAENMVVEIVDTEGRVVPPGTPGEIVVTDLTNYSMPLIRYKMRDFGAIDPEPCACGRGLPVLKEVFGREYDILVNARGEKFHGEFFLYMIEDAKKMNLPVRGYQIEQTAVDKLVINIVASDLVYSEISKYILAKIKTDFDANINITFNKVENIAREKSGKLRVIKRAF